MRTDITAVNIAFNLVIRIFKSYSSDIIAFIYVLIDIFNNLDTNIDLNINIRTVRLIYKRVIRYYLAIISLETFNLLFPSIITLLISRVAVFIKVSLVAKGFKKSPFILFPTATVIYYILGSRV